MVFEVVSAEVPRIRAEQVKPLYDMRVTHGSEDHGFIAQRLGEADDGFLHPAATSLPTMGIVTGWPVTSGSTIVSALIVLKALTTNARGARF